MIVVASGDKMAHGYILVKRPLFGSCDLFLRCIMTVANSSVLQFFPPLHRSAVIRAFQNLSAGLERFWKEGLCFCRIKGGLGN